MLPEILLLGKSVSTYWLMFFVGLAGMIVICWRRANHYCCASTDAGKKTKAVIYVLLLAFFGLLGTKVLYILENLQMTIENGLTLGGQSFFGALFLVPIAMIGCGRLLGMRPLASTDYCAPPVIFILLCMRLGCFMNGCCGGIELCNVIVPAQLIEAVGDACIFVFLLYCEAKEQRKGQLYPLLMMLYGLLRFFVEIVRDTPKDVLLFSRGQLYSIVTLAVALAWIARLRYEKKK